MRVVVAIPPHFLLTGPVAAAAVLTAVLREQGHDAIGFDVNRFCVDRLLSPVALQDSLTRGVVAPTAAHAACWSALPDSIEDAVTGLQNGDAFVCTDRYRFGAQLDVEAAMDLHARAHGRSSWSSVDYVSNCDRHDAREFFATTERGGELFDAPLDEAARAIADFQPGLIAISVAVPQQLYCALRLARRVKQLSSRVHITLGGASVTKLRRAFRSLPEVFDILDSVIFREGELPLLALVRCLEQAVDPGEHIPGIVCRSTIGSIRAHAEMVSLSVLSRTAGRDGGGKGGFDLRKMPVPVFDDLIPGKYLSPRLLLPLSTTRNCYFDKCDFCSISRSFNTGYREMTPRQMVNQMIRLAERHPHALFKDVSEALPPRLLFPYADELIASGCGFEWEAYLRFEEAFNSDHVARKLSESGLAVAYFGLESGSQVLCDTMRKHIDVGTAEQTIRRFADAGIWVHLFLMAGHPGETEGDHEETLEVLRRNGDYIHSIQSAGFQMELDSDIVKLTDRFGFRVRDRIEPSFSTGFEFEQLGTVPDAETIDRRVREIRLTAFTECGPVLAASRAVWDGHKIIFAVRQGGPSLPIDDPFSSPSSIPSIESRCVS